MNFWIMLLQKHNRLQAERELLILKLQTNAIESPDAIAPVIFSGMKEEIDNLVSDYNLKINNSQRLEAGNNHIDKYVVEATTSKQYLENMIKDLTVKDFDPLQRTIFGSFGIQSNPYNRRRRKNKFHHTPNTLRAMELGK